MKTMKLPLFGILFSLVMLFGAAAHAGLTADVTLKYYDSGKPKRVSKGKYFYQDKKVMVEHLAETKTKPAPSKKTAEKTDAAKAKEPSKREPVKQAFIYDQQASKGTMLLHFHKKYMEIDANQPRSWEQNFWNRFLSQGGISVNPDEFKKRQYTLVELKSEKYAGHPCKVWKATKALGGQTQVVKIWSATDLNDVPVKVSVSQGTELVSEFTLANIKQAQVDEAVFSPPKEYTQYQPKIMVGGMPDMKNGKPGAKGGMQVPKNTAKVANKPS